MNLGPYFADCSFQRKIINTIDALRGISHFSNQFKVCYALTNCHLKLMCVDHSGESSSVSLAHGGLSKEIGVTSEEYAD